jgi:hypothetical protein
VLQRKANAAENEVSTSLAILAVPAAGEPMGEAAAVDLIRLAILLAKLQSFFAERRRLNLRVSLVFAIFAGVVESDGLMVRERTPMRSF